MKRIKIHTQGKAEEAQPLFPNGFESWQETHFEVVKNILWETSNGLQNGDENNFWTLYANVYKKKGDGGLYELAKEITDGFEKLYTPESLFMDSDDKESMYYETLEAFLHTIGLLTYQEDLAEFLKAKDGIGELKELIASRPIYMP